MTGCCKSISSQLGARPSSGAASPDRCGSPAFCRAVAASGLAAPEDGRAPLCQLLSLCSSVTLVLLLAGCNPRSSRAPLAELKCYPPDIFLSSAKAKQPILVQAVFENGITRDITAQAQLGLADPRVARLDKAALAPVADGKTQLSVRCWGRTLLVPVVVSNAMVQPAISFR